MTDRILDALEAERGTAIAAAYEAAAKIALARIEDPDLRNGRDREASEIARLIRALTPADAIAARDADRARVRREALEDAIEAALFHVGSWEDVQGDAAAVIAEDIRAMIEEEGNG